MVKQGKKSLPDPVMKQPGAEDSREIGGIGAMRAFHDVRGFFHRRVSVNSPHEQASS
jgi:hypothetical protein